MWKHIQRMPAKCCSRHPLTILGMTECARGASMSLELVNRFENQWFLTRSNSAPGFAFFEPVPTVLSRCAFGATVSTASHFSALHVIPVADSKQQCSISSYVPILNQATGERGAGRGQFSPAGGDIITIAGTAFGPSGLNSRFSIKVKSVLVDLLEDP